MSGVRLLLIITENHTMRPMPDIGDLVRFAVMAEQARGFTTICVKPSQFIDDQTKFAGFCEQLVAKVPRLR